MRLKREILKIHPGAKSEWAFKTFKLVQKEIRLSERTCHDERNKMSGK